MILFWIDDDWASIKGLAPAFRGRRAVDASHVWVHIIGKHDKKYDPPDSWQCINVDAALSVPEIISQIDNYANNEPYSVALDLMLESTDSAEIDNIVDENTALLSMKILKKLKDSNKAIALYSKSVRGEDGFKSWKQGYNSAYGNDNAPLPYDYNDISASGAPNKAVRDRFNAELGLNVRTGVEE